MEYSNFITDATLQQALGAVGNNQSRLGTARDSSRNIVINDVPLLSRRDCYNLVRNSALLREIVTAYPVDALRLCPEFNLNDANFESGDLKDYFESLLFVDIADKEFYGRDAFKEAQIVANIEGNAYIYLDIDDGLDDSEPVDYGRIRSITGGSIWGQNRLSYNAIQRINGETVSGGNYLLSGLSDVRTVHKSRIIRFEGGYLTGDELIDRAFRNPSVLQAIYEKFCLMELTGGAVYNYLQTASLFWYKMQGLAQLSLQKKETDLRTRFETFLMGRSSLGGFILDADREEIGFIERSFSGLDPLLKNTEEQFIAASGIPRGRLYKTSNQGAMSESGKSDHEQWAELVSKYQSDTILPKLNQLTDIILSAQDSPSRGVLVPYSITVPSILVESEKQHAETYKIYSEADKNYYDMGLDGKTIIDSRFAGSDYGKSITLGEDYMREDEPQVQQAQLMPETEGSTPVADASEKIQIDPNDLPLTETDYETILSLLGSD
jgi:hypothetical protein